MSVYQLRLLSDMSDIGAPGQLPAAIGHLTDPELADLSWLTSIPAYSGKGFFPVDQDPPADLTNVVSPYGFKRLLTSAERIAIRAAAAGNAQLADFMDLLDTAPVVHLDDPITIAGVQTLEAATLIASGRAAEILAGTRPA